MIEIEMLGRLMEGMEAERGPFDLFGLFKREDSGQWDLVISAPWLEGGKLEALRKFVKEMSDMLDEEQVLRLSQIVTLNGDDPALHAILNEVGPVTGTSEPIEKQGPGLFGLPVEHAYILRATRLQEKPTAR